MLNEILSILCFQSFIKLFNLSQIKEEITMSKENAIKFCELMGKNPEILKEGEKHDKGQGDVYAIFSELAKEKGFDCTASELKEVMEDAQKGTSELGDDDLEDVAGGAAGRRRSKTEKGILAAIAGIGGALEGMGNAAGKDGKIDWSNPTTYGKILGGGINKGVTSWSSDDDDGDE